jgi:hypothetical protein
MPPSSYTTSAVASFVEQHSGEAFGHLGQPLLPQKADAAVGRIVAVAGPSPHIRGTQTRSTPSTAHAARASATRVAARALLEIVGTIRAEHHGHPRARLPPTGRWCRP